jgi:hypothetical protein
MTTGNVPAASPPVTSTTAAASTPPVAAPASWPWRRGALILASVAQLITISALTSADPLAVTWFSRSGSGASRPDPAWRCYR